MTAPGRCPDWCDKDPCRGEHHPGTEWQQDLPVIEGLNSRTLLSVFPVWDELDDQPPQVSLYLDSDTQIYMSAGQAGQVATWLLESADKVDLRKMFTLVRGQ